MSKLIKMYKQLKQNNSETLYLFKSGMFYIFLDEDAKFVSQLLLLKLTNLNTEVVKCGFPHNSLEKYLTLLKNCTSRKVEIVENTSPITSTNNLLSTSLNSLFQYVRLLDINNLSIREAYSALEKIQNEIKNYPINNKEEN